MLDFEALNSSSKKPKGGRIFEPVMQSRDRVANVNCNGVRESKIETRH
jgi:hypothetical protein